ncbi:MAG: GMC family oxidoreductase [Chloroflexi bacterium]|nr:GMC family oxidoreductase [Chloroflexota bacterium]
MTAESGDKRRPDPDEPAVISPITRRTFLRGALATAGATILAACAPGGTADRPLGSPYNTATPASVLVSPPAPATGAPQPGDGTPQPGAISLEQFLMLSAVLTGMTNLDTVAGNVYLQSLQTSDEFDVSLSDLVEQAGLLVAWRLAAAGIDVLVLESGPRVNRAEAVQTFRNAVAKTPESPYPDVPHAPRPSVTALEDYYVQVGPQLFKSNYERRVGGTTWHWLGTTLRHLPNDFRIRSLYDVGVDWPISYEELAPWYNQAEQAMGVAGDSGDDLGSPRDMPFPQPPLPMSYLDNYLKAAVKPLGMSVRLTPQARNSLTYDGRPPCCGNATCVPICPIAAKYDASVQARKAEDLGARIIENAVAHFVEVNNEGMVTGVRFKRPDGSEERATGRLFVVAANAIETPKLLLISRTDALPGGVANSSDAVGRYLMDHPIQLSWALANDPIFPHRSPLENAGIEDFRDGEFRRERSAIRLAVGEDGWSFPGTPLTALATELIAEGYRSEALANEVNQRAARQFRFACLVEQMPLAENRVTPAWDQVDAIGIPRPQLDYRLDEFTERGLAEARRICDLIFDAVGVSFRMHGEEFFGAGHLIGTYRMGDDPSSSVVDREQRSHDHPNLFLLGAGVFPASGTANPTLTLAALALWAAETIRQDVQAL